MQRHAILISAASNANECVNLWQQFLISAVGGSWKEHEITLSQRRSRSELHAIIQAGKKSEYTLIVFIGNGHFVKTPMPWLEMQVSLENGEQMLEQELNTGSPRCEMIFDCCQRIPENGYAQKEIPSSLQFDFPQRASNVRELYDHTVQSAESGLIRLYATGTINSGAEQATFSHALLDCAISWSRNNMGVLSLKEAVENTVKSSLVTTSNVKVEYNSGRRLNHFPFAVGSQS